MGEAENEFDKLQGRLYVQGHSATMQCNVYGAFHAKRASFKLGP